MSKFLNSSEFGNENLNDSNGLLDNRSMTLEFALFDDMKIKKYVSIGLGLKVFLVFLLLIMETLGNYLLFCMVWYEKFGMDTKKRTITNQLLSRMILALIFFNIVFMPLYICGFFIPFGSPFYLNDFVIEPLGTGRGHQGLFLSTLYVKISFILLQRKVKLPSFG